MTRTLRNTLILAALGVVALFAGWQFGTPSQGGGQKTVAPGTLVFPGDIVVGDEDGVVVIPRHLADKVATSGLEQEQVEAYIKRRVELGEPIAGFYPASERTMADYHAWVAKGRPSLG